MAFHCRKQPSSRVLQLSLSFALLVHTTPCCPTMSSLQRRFGLPTDLTPFICHSCASNSPSVIFHLGHVSHNVILFNNILVFQLILHPLSAMPLCASNSPSIIFYLGDVSSPFPFHIAYVLDCVYMYVTLVLCLMMVLQNLSFSLILIISFSWSVGLF